MDKEKKAINDINQNNVHAFSCIGAMMDKDQDSMSSKVYSDSGFGNLEILIQLNIKNILETNLSQSDTNWDLIKLLGDFLKIQNYNTNLFSSWILRSLLQQVIYHADVLNQCEYTLFIYWIFEEINLIRYSADMTRDTFFRLINNIFQIAMMKILEGQGLLHPLELINQSWEEESRSISKIDFAKCDSEITFSLRNDEESVINSDMQTDPQFESRIKYFETVLHAVIEATYELFGRESDYALIQISSLDEENSLNYTIPYYFRKARVVKKEESNQKQSTISNAKQAKTSKKKKTTRKSLSDNVIPSSNDNGSNLNQYKYILPLSDAILCQDIPQFTEGERATKGIFDI